MINLNYYNIIKEIKNGPSGKYPYTKDTSNDTREILNEMKLKKLLKDDYSLNSKSINLFPSIIKINKSLIINPLFNFLNIMSKDGNFIKNDDIKKQIFNTILDNCDTIMIFYSQRHNPSNIDNLQLDELNKTKTIKKCIKDEFNKNDYEIHSINLHNMKLQNCSHRIFYFKFENYDNLKNFIQLYTKKYNDDCFEIITTLKNKKKKMKKVKKEKTINNINGDHNIIDNEGYNINSFNKHKKTNILDKIINFFFKIKKLFN